MPTVPATTVSRPRLSRVLDARAALTLVEGPTGSGGTTLVAAWAHNLEQRGDAVAWGTGVLPRLPTGAGPAIVVIDRGEELDRAGVVAAVAACAGRPQTSLVVLARPTSLWTRPDVVGGAFGERLSGADLAATRTEVIDLAAAWGHRVEHDEVDVLLEASGGWLIGLRALLDTRAGDRSVDLDAACLRVLTVGGLEPPNPEAGYVGLRVCLLAGFDMSDARVACLPEKEMSEAELAAVIDAMLRHGLLVRRRAPGPVQWRLTGLMANFAQHGLAEDDTLRRLVAARLAHHRAARLRSGRGVDPLDVDAVAAAAEVAALARTGAEWALLAECWAAQSCLHRDAAFSAVFHQLPVEATSQSPVLAVAAEDVAGRRGVRPAMDHDLSACATTDQAVVVLTESIWHDALGGRHGAALADVRRLNELVGSVQNGVPEGGSARATRLATAASAYWLAGDDVVAAELFEQAYDAARRASHPGAAEVAARALLLHLRAGSSAEVIAQWTARADQLEQMEQVAQADQGSVPVLSALAAAYDHRRAVDLLDEERATAALQAWRAGATLPEGWHLGLEIESTHLTTFGDPAQAIRVLEAAAERTTDELGLVTRAVQRGVAEAMIALGEFHRLAGWLADHRRPDGSMPTWLEVPAAWLLLRTESAERAHRAITAVAQTRRLPRRDLAELALIAAAAGPMEPLPSGLQCGEPTVLVGWSRLSAQEAARLWPGDLPRSLAGRISTGPEPVWIRLTPRERVILDHLVTHDGAQAIARELTVSVNTVKKQIVSLYAKLGVHGRADALLAARRWGLLGD